MSNGPTAQAEAPYLQMVIGASPEFFRPGNPDAEGEFELVRVAQFEREAVTWLKTTFGDDLIHASMHLDEITPHIHALVAPTYQKAARKPGKKKRGETDADFEARKRVAAETPTVRTVGRRSNKLTGARFSFQHLRRSLADHLGPLGIEYGRDLNPSDPTPQTTRHNLKEENHKMNILNASTQKRVRSANDYAKALEVGIVAVAANELVYRPATEKDQNDGLIFGPAAPDDRTWREKLVQKVRPAFRRILLFAKNVHQLKENLKIRAREEVKAEMKIQYKVLEIHQAQTYETALELTALAQKLRDKEALEKIKPIRVYNRPRYRPSGLERGYFP